MSGSLSGKGTIPTKTTGGICMFTKSSTTDKIKIFLAEDDDLDAHRIDLAAHFGHRLDKFKTEAPRVALDRFDAGGHAARAVDTEDDVDVALGHKDIFFTHDKTNSFLL